MTFEDMNNRGKQFSELEDEFDPASDGKDLSLAKASFNSGWVQLTKGSTTTITHNLGVYPRQYFIVWNTTASDAASSFDNGGDTTALFKVTNASLNTVTVENNSTTTANKFFKLRLWK